MNLTLFQILRNSKYLFDICFNKKMVGSLPPLKYPQLCDSGQVTVLESSDVKCDSKVGKLLEHGITNCLLKVT